MAVVQCPLCHYAADASLMTFCEKCFVHFCPGPCYSAHMAASHRQAVLA